MKIFLIPFAGGASNYYSKWLDDKIEFVPLDYSGHGMRMGEQLCHGIKETAQDLWNLIKNRIKDDEEYAIFGHSLGGLITYELYKYITIMKFKKPIYLFISGCRAPHLKSRVNISQLDEEMYKRELIALGGVSDTYFENKILYQLFNPILKNDLSINDNYIDHEKMKIECGVTIINGKSDEAVNVREKLAWKEYCKGECNFLMYDGGHFYLSVFYKEIIDVLKKTVLKMVME